MDFEEKVEFITCSRVNGLPEDCKPEKCATCTFKLPNIDGVASEIARLKVESAPGIREEIWKAACCTENIDNPCLPDKECKECTICRVLEAVQPLIEQARQEGFDKGWNDCIQRVRVGEAMNKMQYCPTCKCLVEAKRETATFNGKPVLTTVSCPKCCTVLRQIGKREIGGTAREEK